MFVLGSSNIPSWCDDTQRFSINPSSLVMSALLRRPYGAKDGEVTGEIKAFQSLRIWPIRIKKLLTTKILTPPEIQRKRLLWRSIASSPFTEQFGQIIIGNQKNVNTQHNLKNHIPSTSKY